MKQTASSSQWDAKRLIQEYFKMASLIKSYHGKSFDDIAWSNQIRIKRIASALHAFMGLKETEGNPIDFISSAFDGWDFDRLFEESPLQEEDHATLMALVKEAMNDDRRYESLLRMDGNHHEHPFLIERKKYQERRSMLRVLLKYRESAEKLISHFDGIMEGSVGTYLCVLAVKGLCVEPLKRNNEKIDDMIILLLGDKFKQSFPEEELKAAYGYPRETDAELSEWDSDNM